jgi:hypothetical protein
MRRIREVLRLRAELGANLSAIAAGAKLARSTVRAYLDRAAAAGLDAGAANGLSETALEAALYPPSPAGEGRMLPDWAEVDQELRRHKHVTRKLLWMEYKAVQPDGLGFTPGATHEISLACRALTYDDAPSQLRGSGACRSRA